MLFKVPVLATKPLEIFNSRACEGYFVGEVFFNSAGNRCRSQHVWQIQNGPSLLSWWHVGASPACSSEWQCAEICARDPSQPLPPVAMLLSRSCERAAFLHLPAIFPRLLPAVSLPCPFFSMLPSPFWIQAQCCSSMFCFYTSGSWSLTCGASCSMWICVSEESQEGNQGVHPVFVHTA